MTMTPYHQAIIEVASRYENWNPSDRDLHAFREELIKGCLAGMPIEKANRWLGYIQGVLISRGITTVEEERDWTRPLFRPLDYPETEII